MRSADSLPERLSATTITGFRSCPRRNLSLCPAVLPRYFAIEMKMKIIKKKNTTDRMQHERSATFESPYIYDTRSFLVPSWCRYGFHRMLYAHVRKKLEFSFGFQNTVTSLRIVFCWRWLDTDSITAARLFTYASCPPTSSHALLSLHTSCDQQKKYRNFF